jgi:adenylate cyclase
MGLNGASAEAMSEEDVEIMKYVAAMLAAGLPLVAFLQLARVYGQALAQIADAEVRLFHLYVHEPLMREGIPGLEMAEQIAEIGRCDVSNMF